MYDMNGTTKLIANKVRGVAAEHGLTQQDIADTLRLSRSAVVERFNGRVPFTATELYMLAATVDIPVGRFFPERVGVAA